MDGGSGWVDENRSAKSPPLAGSSGAALGSDPFEALESDPDPFLEALELMGQGSRVRLAATPLAWERPASRPDSAAWAGPGSTDGARSADSAGSADSADSRSSPTPFLRRRWAPTPALEEIDMPDSSGLIDRLLSEDDRRRLAALSHLVENEALYDRYGLSPDVLRRAFPIFSALHRLYFRVRSEGHEHIPAEGPAIFVANHAGMLPFDGAMICIDTVLHTNPPRLTRAIVDRWAGSLPWVGVFYARVGQVVGTRENFADLLSDGQIPLVFPEGMEGVRKPITQRYRLQRFGVGFVEQALRARAPIVPIAVIGSENQAPVLYNMKALAKALGLPMVPITPTFPWLGPLGLLPYPVNYKIIYAEPLHVADRFGPEAADDPKIVQYLARQVRRIIQQLLDTHR